MFGNFFNKFIPCGRIKRPNLGRSDLPECRANAPFLFDDVYKNGTRGEKKQADARQYGRSMVEMLGVLAIIGVLSVGGIAGYDRAMFKYKLNKQADDFNQLITNATRLGSDLNRSYQGTSFEASFFKKLNLIPDGMRLKGETINDIFDTIISIHYGWTTHLDGGGAVEYYMGVALPRTNNKITQSSSDICHNILNVIKEHSDSILRVETRSGNTNTTGSTYDVNNALYGDMRCKGKNCLKSMTLDDIKKTCYSCTSEKYCNMVIYFPT